jgi:hypothetical protein
LQVLACIENRFTQLEEKLDWESAINEAHGILPENDPLTQSGQDSQPTARTPQILYRNEVSPASRNLGLESQGDREVLEEAAVQKSELEKLIETLPFAETAEDFANLVEGSPQEVIEDAIVFQPDQPRRQQLMQWLQGLNFPAGEVEPCQSWQETIKAYAGLLAEGMLFGVEVVKTLLKPWSSEQRWAAFLQLESQAPEKMRRLAATVPDWYKLCDAT